MQQNEPLFRPAALAARRTRVSGSVVLARPLPLRLLSLASAAAACAVLALLAVGSYAPRSTLTGQLVPEGGLVHVHAPQPGRVAEKYVTEGQAVRRGDLLYVIVDDLLVGERGRTRELIAAQLERRRRSLARELDALRRLERSEASAQARRVALLEGELGALHAMRADQEQRVTLARDAAARHDTLVANGFLAVEQLRVTQVEWMEQNARLQLIERDALALTRQLEELRAEIGLAPLRFQSRLAQLERASASLDQELAENEVRRRALVEAPLDGTATVLTAEFGQLVDGSRPLVTIVPRGRPLVAHLYAPTRAIGLVRAGDEVRLRYAAYPYQKFGHHNGIVTTLSRTAVPAAALLDGLVAAPAGGEPTYRVIVALDAQLVQAYGRTHALQSGMLVEADVLGDRRRLYEWVLEPLYALAARTR